MEPVIYCADIGSGRFGWARRDPDAATVEGHRGGSEVADLVAAVKDDLDRPFPVALRFECPLFVPVPEHALRLGMARRGEGNRSWSGGCGRRRAGHRPGRGRLVLGELQRRRPTHG